MGNLKYWQIVKHHIRDHKWDLLKNDYIWFIRGNSLKLLSEFEWLLFHIQYNINDIGWWCEWYWLDNSVTVVFYLII